MSFVYIPIPGCSVHEGTQLHAALPARPPCLGGSSPRAWGSWVAPSLTTPSGLSRVLLPVLVKPFYNLARASSCALSLSLLFFLILLLFLATCTFLTKFIVAIKVFYFPIHIYSCIKSMRSKAT